jgi:cytidylate kinase
VPGITISASYGTGGASVAALVAERLGYRLLDRAITTAVASQLRISESEAVEGERKRTLGDRFLRLVLPMSPFLVGDPDAVLDDSVDFRDATENLMRDAVQAGAVILGRAGAAALLDHDDVMRVRLYGAVDDRIAHAVANSDLDEKTAREQLPLVDGARAEYWQHLYDRDIDDPGIYHLQVNAPLLAPERCADVIVAAFGAFTAEAG